jgi:hypothetical protein
VELLLDGVQSKMVGLNGNTIISKDLKYVCRVKKRIDRKMYKLAEELAI